MSEKNKTIWEWQGRDELTKILKGIDDNILKIDRDTTRMEKDMDRAMKGSGRSVDYLRDKLKRLSDARDTSFNPDMVKRFNREIANTEREITRIQRLGTTGGFRNAMNNMPFGNTLMAGMSNPYVLGGMAAAASGKMVADAVRYDRNLNTEMAKINATAQITPEALMGLKNSFFATANKYSLDVETIPMAYEGILSATGNKAMTDRVIDPALRLGKAGFTDAKTTGLALSQLMMTPGVNMTPEQIADMLMAAKNFGKGELGDFARYLPGLIGTGKMKGFQEQEVTGAYAYLTRSNSAERAEVLLKNFLSVIMRKDVTNALKEKGINVYRDGKVLGLDEMVRTIGNAMKGLSNEAKNDFLTAIKVTDQEAQLAFGNLTAGADQLSLAIETMTNSAGTLNTTLKYVQDGNEGLVQFSNNWKELKKNLGDVFIPPANAALSFANRTYDFYSDENYKNFMTEDEFKAMMHSRELKLLTSNFTNTNPLGKVDEFISKASNMEGSLPIGLKSSGIGGLKMIREYMRKMGFTNEQIKLDQKQQIISQPEPDNNQNSERLTAATNNRTVRNVTVNIETLMKVDKVAMGDTEGKSVDSTLEEVLNGLVKVIRDSEQAVETY